MGSAGVTRPGRPGLDLDKQPPAVRMNDELGGLLTWKLKVKLCKETFVFNAHLRLSCTNRLGHQNAIELSSMKIARSGSIKVLW